MWDINGFDMEWFLENERWLFFVVMGVLCVGFLMVSLLVIVPRNRIPLPPCWLDPTPCNGTGKYCDGSCKKGRVPRFENPPQPPAKKYGPPLRKPQFPPRPKK